MENAHLNYLLGHTFNAIESYTNAILLNANPEAYYARAMCYMQQKKYSESIDDLNNCGPCSFTQAVLYKRGVAKFHLGKYEECLQDLSTAAAMDTKSEIYSSIAVWIGKCKCEANLIDQKMEEDITPTIPTNLDATPLPKPNEEISSKVEATKLYQMPLNYIFQQNDCSIIIQLKEANMKKENITYKSSAQQIEIIIDCDNNISHKYSFNLFKEIVPNNIELKISENWIVFIIQKKESNEMWDRLECSAMP